jgi:hypothetical protein
VGQTTHRLAPVNDDREQDFLWIRVTGARTPEAPTNAAINTPTGHEKSSTTHSRRIKMDDFDRNDFDDLTQEQLQQLMQTDLDFTSTEIDANRKYHGKLFLSEDVVYSSVYGFEAGATYCKTTGELIEPKVTREIKGVKKAVDKVFDEALDTFENWQTDPVQHEAIRSLVAHVTTRLIILETELDASAP